MNMESKPIVNKEKEIDAFDLLKKTFLNTRTRTESEYQKNFQGEPKYKNSWLACILSDFFTAQLMFDELERQKKVDDLDYKDLSEKLTQLAHDVRDLKAVYPTAEDVPPEDVKEELFSRFEQIGIEIIACIKDSPAA